MVETVTRVVEGATAVSQIISGNMNREHLAETRRETIYRDGGNADIASLHGKDCTYNPIAFPPSMEVRCNLVGQCRSGCRGANICHPWGLGIRIPVSQKQHRLD